MTAAAVFLVALLCTLAATPLVIGLAKRLGAVDLPNRDRHLHGRATARLGGVALAIGFCAALAASFILPQQRNDDQEIIRLTGLLLGLAVVLAVGILDDLRELPAWPQFAAQFLAAGIVVAFNVRIDELPTPFGAATLSDWFAVLFTLFWLIGMMNTVNFLDGLDGLATGVVGIACLILFLHTSRLGQDSIALLPLALFGALIGFLPFNFSPARIFLGTSGALFIGLALGTLSIIGGAKVASALLVLGIPILDTAWQIVRRMRDGRAPYHGDRGHLHFLLVDRGWPQRQVVLMLYGLSTVFGVMALGLPSGMLKALALGGMTLIMLVMMLRITRKV